MPFLKINHSGFEQARRLAGGSDRKLARLLQVDPSSLSRILGGHVEPTGRLIAGAVAAFGAGWFQLLFEVVDE